MRRRNKLLLEKNSPIKRKLCKKFCPRRTLPSSLKKILSMFNKTEFEHLYGKPTVKPRVLSTMFNNKDVVSFYSTSKSTNKYREKDYSR